MIKNILITFMFMFSTITSSMAQVPTYTLKADLLVPERSELVTKPRSVTEIVKERFRKESFILKGETAQQQGYILSITDRKVILGILERCEQSCGSLVDVVDDSCQRDLEKCQKDCDERIKTIETTNDQLREDKKLLQKELKLESKKTIIYTSVASFVGIGLGALIVTVSK